MADGVFHVSVVTPEAQLLEAQAKALVLRSSTGELTILEGHTPIITDVVPGDVRVDQAEGEPVHLAVHGGYLHVETGPGLLDDGDQRGTRATLLAGVAELADQIDVERARRAKEAAESRIEELRAATGRTGPAAGAAGAPAGTAGAEGTVVVTEEDVALVEAEDALRRADVRLEVAGDRA
jgi:F-type H+-transporting ATPase subunit epsilon